jgi:hypothetical protein
MALAGMFTTAKLEEAIVVAFDAVPLDFIRKVANVSHRYIQLYREGATGRLAAFAARKYKSHRCVPDSWLTEVVNEYEAEYDENASCSMLQVPTKEELAVTIPAAHAGSNTESDQHDENESKSESESESESEDDAAPSVARQAARWAVLFEQSEKRSTEAVNTGKRQRKAVSYNEKHLEQNYYHT